MRRCRHQRTVCDGTCHQPGGRTAEKQSAEAQYLFLTTQGADVATYANAIHANLQNGKPVYDGYLLKAGFRWAGSANVRRPRLQTIRGRW